MTLEGFNALNTIDLVIGSLIFVLGIKGLFNGARREVFGFAGLIGGVLIASRAAKPLAALAEERLIRLSNPAVMELIAFILTLLVVWGLVSVIGNAVENRFAKGSPSAFSRLLGFVITALKYFLVFSMIVAALYRTPFIRDTLGKNASESLLFPYLDRSGSYLINLTPLGRTSGSSPDRNATR